LWLIAVIVGFAAVPAVGAGAYVAMRVFSRETLPVETAWCESLIGNGLVLQMTNRSARHLTATLDTHNPTTGASMTFDLYLPPGQITEWGWAEGWRFTSGDYVVLRSAGFRSVRLVAP
jgi:hypothetical protein